MAVLGPDRLLPGAVGRAEVAEAAGFRVVGGFQEDKRPTNGSTDDRTGQLPRVEQVHGQRTRDVVGADPVSGIRGQADGVLHDTESVVQAVEVGTNDSRERGSKPVVRALRQPLDNRRRRGNPARGLGEERRVLVRHHRPRHRFGVLASPSAELSPKLWISEQLLEPRRERGDVVEGDQGAAPVAKQLGGVLVRRGDAGTPCGCGQGECPGGRLLRVSVGCDEDVAGLQPGDQLVGLDEAVHEGHLILQAQARDLVNERAAVLLAMAPTDLWMCRAQDHEPCGRRLAPDRSQRLDHELQPFCRPQQSEREDRGLVREPQPSPRLARLRPRDARHAVWHDRHLGVVDRIDGAQATTGRLAHDHHAR